jgi:hypothetical protein
MISRNTGFFETAGCNTNMLPFTPKEFTATASLETPEAVNSGDVLKVRG